MSKADGLKEVASALAYQRTVGVDNRIAELERQYRICERNADTYYDQLTKAKEIIKGLLSSKTDFDERRFVLWVWKEEVSKAEQFLKE
jgi:hypothetical protein